MADVATLSALTATPHANPFPGEEPKVVRLALDAGERVDPHRHPDRQIVCYLLSGRMELDLDEETHELAAGDLIRFDGRREVSPRGVEDCEALLVLAPRSSE
ncbi:cupin domain-containing protein [Halorientalis brevis]|uniref:Cupin domain-containing protein n=1 Tax=Halorientalis brevis TaxID=1126241 RepID=A0ABD6CG27_9EURY|nr:cupin domain-containing protein [Halorientalis brevis]